MKTLFSLLLSLYLVGCSATQWITDTTTGCEVFNRSPVPGEFIRYKGDCKNGRANGLGSVTWFQDSVATSTYTGNFISGKLDGRVSALYYESSIDRFEGAYHEGVREGLGIYYYIFGKTVSGVFHNGTLSDSVSIQWKNGKRYIGQVVHTSDMEGPGELIFPNGDKYIGEFEKNKRQGTGSYIWSNGDRYDGHFKDDTIYGTGTYYYATGDKLSLQPQPHDKPLYKMQSTLLRTGLLDENSAQELSASIKLPYPHSLQKAGAEMEATIKLLIGTDGKVKKYKFSVDKIFPYKKQIAQGITSNNTNKTSTIDEALFVDRISNDEAANIVNVFLSKSFPSCMEEGECFKAWVRFPLHFHLR
jgi:hypothetical protein